MAKPSKIVFCDAKSVPVSLSLAFEFIDTLSRRTWLGRCRQLNPQNGQFLRHVTNGSLQRADLELSGTDLQKQSATIRIYDFAPRSASGFLQFPFAVKLLSLGVFQHFSYPF